MAWRSSADRGWRCEISVTAGAEHAGWLESKPASPASASSPGCYPELTSLALRGFRGTCHAATVHKRILVVDDEQDMLDLVAYNLGQQGYEVDTALSGLVALQKIRRHLPDLVVLDLMLADLDGFSVCEILRGEPATSGIPVLAITAYSGEMPRLNALDAGANGFLPKPFSSAELSRQVAALLASQEQPPACGRAANRASRAGSESEFFGRTTTKGPADG
jgi:CheY-like chemotaxis protein